MIILFKSFGQYKMKCRAYNSLSIPQANYFLSHSFRGVSLVACGVWHTVAVASDTHDVFCWGWNKYGQCGVSVTADPVLTPSPFLSSFPTRQRNPPDIPGNPLNIPVDPFDFLVNNVKQDRRGT